MSWRGASPLMRSCPLIAIPCRTATLSWCGVITRGWARSDDARGSERGLTHPSSNFRLQPRPSCPHLRPLLELQYVLGDAHLLWLELALACRWRPRDRTPPVALEL